MFGSKVDPALARVGVVIVLTLIVLGLTAILVGGATAFYRREGADLASLLQKMADIIDGARTTMPDWMQDIMPTDAETLRDDAAGWLREHAVELRKAGGEVGRGLAYALIGMVIGALLAVREIAPARVPGPLARALQRCALLVEDSFSRVVLAQIRISALNTLLTAIYLAGVLPAFGVHLPLTKTMVTAGGLVFTGNTAGDFAALDEATGKVLWQFKTPSGVNSQPITYTYKGKQYVSVFSGLGGGTSARRETAGKVLPAGTVWTFALMD